MAILRMSRTSLWRSALELALVAGVVVLLALYCRPSPVGQVRGARTDWRRHGVVFRVPTREKVVALTFDDGPDPEWTPKILDTLRRYRVKATFFMIGKRMEQYPELVRRVVLEGHAIGNHTYTHPRNIEEDTRTRIAWELEQCERVIERITGSRTRLFRPPRGRLDATVFAIAEDEGYRVILWSICADRHDAPTPPLMEKRVLARIAPGGIILSHDGTGSIRKKDTEAAPLIIAALLKRGYRFVTIPELLEAAGKSTPSRPQQASIGGHVRAEREVSAGAQRLRTTRQDRAR
jgi:peptidoglycan/xylan/chitin deacetylase (PgdA/CDA1 family)